MLPILLKIYHESQDTRDIATSCEMLATVAQGANELCRGHTGLLVDLKLCDERLDRFVVAWVFMLNNQVAG